MTERVLTALLEAAEMPSDEVLDDLAMKDEPELDEGEFKRGKWQPAVDDNVKIRSTPDLETDIDSREIPEGASGRVINHLVAYQIEFDDDDIGKRWVTKAMIEPK